MHDGKGTKLHLAGAQFRPLFAITVSSLRLPSVGPPHKPPRRQSSTSLVVRYARTNIPTTGTAAPTPTPRPLATVYRQTLSATA